jgi:hypothetical protein
MWSIRQELVQRPEIHVECLQSAQVHLRCDVLAKHHHALVVYGAAHLNRGEAENIVTLLETTGAAKVFTISTPIFGDLLASPTGQAKSLSRHMEDQADALLYLGPPSAMTSSHLRDALCSDESYVQMRVALTAPEIDRSREQFLERFAEAEIGVGVSGSRSPPEVHQEV